MGGGGVSEQILLIYVIIKLKEDICMNVSHILIASECSARSGKRRLRVKSLQFAPKRAKIIRSSVLNKLNVGKIIIKVNAETFC